MWQFIGPAADWCSLIGFPVTIWTVAAAFWQARKSRLAAERLSVEIEAFKSQFRATLSVADLSRVLSSIEDIKRLIRNGIFIAVPERLADARHALIAVREQADGLSEADQTAFQSFIISLRGLEKRYDKMADLSDVPQKLKQSTLTLLLQADSLHEALTNMKFRIAPTPSINDN